MLPVVCLIFCTATNPCTIDYCTQRVSTVNRTLSIDCITSPPLNLSATHNHTLEYDSINIRRCSLETFNEMDASVLKQNKIQTLAFESTALSTLAPLQVLEYDLESLSVVSCTLDSGMAQTLPSLHNVQLLNLSMNLLTTIPAAIKSYQSLVTLDISQNRISSLDVTSLPATLIHLFAAENFIVKVKFDLNLSQLKVLDLSTNIIGSLEWLDKSTFPGTCKNINLQGNEISKLEANNLNFLINLNYLDLSSNSIIKLDTLAAVDQIGNGTIDLSQNPLHCTCAVAYLGQSKLWQSQQLPVCATPPDLQGYTLQRLAESTCNKKSEIGEKLSVTEEEGLGTVGMVFLIGKFLAASAVC